MSDQRLHDLVQQELAKGVDKDALKANLIAQGWPAEDVTGAIALSTAPSITPRPLNALLSGTGVASLKPPKQKQKGGWVIWLIVCIFIFGLVAEGTYWYASKSLSTSSVLLDQIVSNASNTPAFIPINPNVPVPATSQSEPLASYQGGTSVVTSNTSPLGSGNAGSSNTNTSPDIAYAPSALTAVTNPDTSATTPTTVTAPAPEPTLSFSVDQPNITSGGSPTLSWSSTNADSCNATNGWSGSQATSGSLTLSDLTQSGQYTLSCTGAGGTVTQSVSVAVTSSNSGGGGGGGGGSTVTPTPAPTLSLSVDQPLIASGGSPTITWSTTNATDCTASNGWSGDQPTSGSQQFSSLTSNVTYTLSCTGAGGSVTQSVGVAINESIPPEQQCPTGDTGTYPDCVAPGAPPSSGSPGTTPDPTTVAAGCAVPATPVNTWYVNASLATSSTDVSGDGSQGNPWHSLQNVLTHDIATQVYASPYTVGESTSAACTQVHSTCNVDGPVQPGDIIYLMSGNYGDIKVIGINSSFITIAAAPGQTPVLSTLTVTGANDWLFEGLKVQSLETPIGVQFNTVLVKIGGSNQYGPVSNIVFTGGTVSSIDDSTAWTQSDWLNDAAYQGINEGSETQPGSSCITVTNTDIANTTYAMAMEINNSLFENNVINGFAGDGIDFAASNLVISHNLIENNEKINSQHDDGMQGQIGYYPTYSNDTIDSNTVIRRASPSDSLSGNLQGISDFNQSWYNLTVTNNLVMVDDYNGMAFNSVDGGLIANNTVLHDGGSDAPTTWIEAGGTTPQTSDTNPAGIVNSNVLIENNISSSLNIATSTGVTAENNYTGYKLEFPNANGSEGFNTATSGISVFGTNNTLDPNLNSYFTDFDPSNYEFNVTPLPGTPIATGFGTPLAIANRVNSLGTRGTSDANLRSLGTNDLLASIKAATASTFANPASFFEAFWLTVALFFGKIFSILFGWI